MKNYQYVYFIGIGGIGMSALARWFSAQCKSVFGYDRTATALTHQLSQEGIAIHFEDQIEAIPQEILQHKDQSLVVYTPAITSHNQVLRYLTDHGYTLHKRAAVLGMISQHHLTLAVAGTHGKTITSSLAAHILHNAGRDMVAFVGGIVQGHASNLIMRGQSHPDTLMVVEADEFDRSFLQLQPDLAIVTTVDPDHLDIYKDGSTLHEAFRTFLARVPTTGQAIVHQKAVQQLFSTEAAPAQLTQYALTDATVSADNVRIREGDFYFDYVSKAVTIKELRLVVPGYHSVENALAVITACLRLGVSPEAIREGMATFQGVEHRFNYILRNERLIFLDDYAHHPTEITALMHTIRALYPDKKVTAIFQPHLYTRTRDFASEFAHSLDLADHVFLLDIYPAREAPIEGVTSACILDQMTLAQKCLCTKAQLMNVINQYGPPELVVTIGAGDIYKCIPRIKEGLLTRRD